MAANVKKVRRESKEIAASVRKSKPIYLKDAPKKIVTKHAKSAAKLNSRLEKDKKKYK